jgi:pyridoxamine 5'-phosphate oxidase
MDPDPFVQFGKWLEGAVAAQVQEPNAMTLATVAPDGAPSARIVLLRNYGPSGFTFFTNYDSRKGKELAANPRAALVFHWQQIERQVRIEGTTERVSSAESDEYFSSRPLGSRLGAWASSQSAVIPTRAELQRLAEEVAARYPTGNVPRPPNWGGYRLTPSLFEFWQSQPSRLHDRLCYLCAGSGAWTIQRLAP